MQIHRYTIFFLCIYSMMHNYLLYNARCTVIPFLEQLTKASLSQSAHAGMISLNRHHNNAPHCNALQCTAIHCSALL